LADPFYFCTQVILQRICDTFAKKVNQSIIADSCENRLLISKIETANNFRSSVVNLCRYQIRIGPQRRLRYKAKFIPPVAFARYDPHFALRGRLKDRGWKILAEAVRVNDITEIFSDCFFVALDRNDSKLLGCF